MDAATLVLILNVSGGQKRVDIPKRDMAQCEAVASEVKTLKPEYVVYCQRARIPAYDGRKQG